MMTESINQPQSQHHPHRRRLVIFIGPPKTASTSLEQFFSTYASDDNNNVKNKKHYATSFSNWTYPYILSHPNGLKEFRHGPNHPDDPEIFGKIEKQIRRVVRHNPHKSILLGTEYLTRIAYPNNNLLDYLVNWTTPIIVTNNTTTTTAAENDDNNTNNNTMILPPPRYTPMTPEIVVLYRSPRMSHLISLWKQATQVVGKEYYGYSFQDWICHTESRGDVEQKLGHYANPLDLVYRLSIHKKLPTFLIDMGGLASSTSPPLDICHVFSCDVLKVPCDTESSSSQIVGLEGVVIHKNSRSGNPNITEAQREAMEQVFTHRDCTYYNQLRNHSLVTIVRRHKLWDQNCPIMEPRYRTNVSTMLDRMQQILECPGSLSSAPLDNKMGENEKHQHSNNDNYNRTTTTATTTTTTTTTPSSEYISESQRIGSQPNTTMMKSLPVLIGWRLEVIQVTGIVLLLIFFWRHQRRRSTTSGEGHVEQGKNNDNGP